MEPFATLDELEARCDWAFDEDEKRAAPGYLEEASDLARTYGRMAWEPETAPRMVKNIVISAVRRFMRNPDGYVVSRAGDETLQWGDRGEDAGTIYFTQAEIKLLRGMAGAGGLYSAGISAWGPHRRTPGLTYPKGYTPLDQTVPVAGYEGEKAFPYFTDPQEPW